MLIVALTPILLVFGAESGAALTPLVAGAYSFQVFLLALYAFRARPLIPGRLVIVAIAYSLSLLIGVALGGRAHNQPYELADIANSILKPLGLLLYIGLFTGVKIRVEAVHDALKFLFYAGAVAVLFGLLRSGPDVVAVLLGGGSSYDANFSSFFGNRNQFGYFVFMALLAGFVCSARSVPLRFRRIIIGLLLAGLIFSMSRGALLASAILIMCLLIFRGRLWMAGALAVATSVAFLVGVRWLPHFGEFERLFLRPEAGLAGRDALWRYGVDVWIESPLFGVGGFRAITAAQNAGMEQTQFHSFYVESLASGGFIEISILLTCLIFPFAKALRVCLHQTDASTYVSGYVALFVLLSFESIGLFSAGYVDTIFTIVFVTIPYILFCQNPAPLAKFDTGSSRKTAKRRKSHGANG
ncbi:O-antigen ligase family protein [Serinicoccus sp. LYQ131]|uniref:O-antigen ligase family protein n=1 Tax=Serinicoccus sp. LYQ131 TaxID=3378797 RepID=UPI00385285D9